MRALPRNYSVATNAVYRATPVSRRTDISCRTRLVDARVDDTCPRSANASTRHPHIAGRTRLVYSRVNHAHTRSPNADARSASSRWAGDTTFRYANALAINNRIRRMYGTHEAQQSNRNKTFHHVLQDLFLHQKTRNSPSPLDTFPNGNDQLSGVTSISVPSIKARVKNQNL